MLLGHHRALIVVGAFGCGDNVCPDPSSERSCRLLRIENDAALGELGFRFGSPLDIDGDGLADLVAGARHVDGVGEASAWHHDGTRIAHWKGESPSGLFGHVALTVPDLDGDGLADVIVAAPHAVADNGSGVVEAYRFDGTRMWRASRELSEAFGWHVTRAGDQDADGIQDVWVGSPSSTTGTVSLISGRDGRVVRTISSETAGDGFGWYVIGTGDLDGDGLGDVAIGAPATKIDGATRGVVVLASSVTGQAIREIHGELPAHLFGEMLTDLDDIDGDGIPDLAVGAPESRSENNGYGLDEVSIISGATGERLHRLIGNDGELYGRMLATLDDVDGDGLRDIAIGAPLFDGRNGRVEVRSARSLALLAEIRGAEHGWFGWHIASSGKATAEPGLVVSALAARGNAGTIEIHELRR